MTSQPTLYTSESQSCLVVSSSMCICPKKMLESNVAAPGWSVANLFSRESSIIHTDFRLWLLLLLWSNFPSHFSSPFSTMLILPLTSSAVVVRVIELSSLMKERGTFCIKLRPLDSILYIGRKKIKAPHLVNSTTLVCYLTISPMRSSFKSCWTKVTSST